MPKAAEYKDLGKHEAILDVATRVFAEVGFANTDVQVIADQAGVGKGTVYRYFGNKAELFLAVADAGMKRLESRVFQAIEEATSVGEIARKAASAYGRFYQQHPELVEILIQERAAFRGSIPATHLVYREKNRGVFEDVLRRGIESGEVRDVDVHAAIDALGNVLYGTVVCGCLGDSINRLQGMAEQAVEFFLQGILISNEDR
jgi:AcrR family transcriptional regulator